MPRGLTNFTIRRAERSDLERIVQMLADDPLGAQRERYESPLPQAYFAAFDAIAADPNNEVVVACRDGAVTGVLQLTFIPGLTYQGGWRALIEGVRVDAANRSSGLGKAMVEHAIERAREPRLPPRAIDDRQDASRGEAVLRGARLRGDPRRNEAAACGALKPWALTRSAICRLLCRRSCALG